MVRTMSALVGGVLLGILVMLAAARFGPSREQAPEVLVRDIVNVPKMPQAVVRKHRDEQYAGMTSVEEVFALPTEFTRSEALYALAGRSDSAGVQKLIFEANRIADDIERVSLLNILFFRLAETDPQSALALARLEQFSAERSIEQTVWRAWARIDLDEALSAATMQTTIAHRNSSAQSLYAAFGYMGNDTTERIEAELGIGPDRSSRARYLYQLADKSPAEAIAFINGLERGRRQQEFVSWLAHYISMRDANSALRYAELFGVASDREHYRRIINSNIARENPQAVIDRLLADGTNVSSSGEFHSAVAVMASIDLDAAMKYFEQARSTDARRMLGSAIALEMAKKDPVEALDWARSHEDARYPVLQMSVLGQIAQTDPQLALTEALNTPNAQTRSNLVANVLQQIAQNDPEDAAAYLDQIQDRQQKLETGKQFAATWIERDPEAAIDWILSQDQDTAGQLLQMAAVQLLNRDIDMAIRLLPKLDEHNQASMRQQIAQHLAISRRPHEAQSFIRQFAGQPGYDQLQASLIAGVAETDVLMAKQLADQLADGNARDRAYVQVIAQRARTSPAEATRWLVNIGDERMRAAAAGRIASQWYAHDRAAAAAWVSRLPAGSMKDDAIMQMSYRWHDLTADQERLIASIEDRDKRGQAKIRHIYNVMRTNPAKARELLEDEDIPDSQRQHVETMISQYGSRF